MLLTGLDLGCQCNHLASRAPFNAFEIFRKISSPGFFLQRNEIFIDILGTLKSNLILDELNRIFQLYQQVNHFLIEFL